MDFYNKFNGVFLFSSLPRRINGFFTIFIHSEYNLHPISGRVHITLLETSKARLWHDLKTVFQKKRT